MPAVTPGRVDPGLFSLEFPQSLGVFDDYAAAQKAVDFLSDEEFPVQNVLIVGTELKQVERVTGRLTTGRVATAGILSGAWFGFMIGLLVTLFASESSWLSTLLGAVGLGAAFGAVWSLTGYAATRGRRDFSSVQQIVATKYEVLVEHRHLVQGKEILARMPGATANPFA